MMAKLVLCCAGGMCLVLAAAGLWLGAGGDLQALAANTLASLGCTTSCSGPGGASTELTAEERRTVDFVVEVLREKRDPATAGGAESRERLQRAFEALRQTGSPKVRAAVMAEMTRAGAPGTGCLAENNCTRYRACSVDRNLALAQGEELERYRQEVALDGQPFDRWMAPSFSLPDTRGGRVSLADYRGTNVALVLLSGHCSHSMETLPILAELRDAYAERNVEIVPVFVNSGDAETVRSRAWEADVGLTLVVSEDKAISRAFDSRMVPSTFLIDEDGRVTRKLVGFKTRAALDAALAELVRS